MILMYHKVAPDSPTMWWVDVDNFYQQLHALRDRHVVYLDDYDPTNPDHVVITFDGVYRNIHEFAAPLLQRFGFPFELFISGQHIGASNDFDSIEPKAEFAGLEELASMVAMGGRLQWHSHSHINLKGVRDPEAIASELDVADDLRQLDPSGFRWFAYPHGDFDSDLKEAVKNRFVGALSCNQGTDTDRYALNRETATNELRLRKQSVSVVIASYNYGAYLVEAIESVLRQTVPPDEILISDDHSTDDTWMIAQDFARRYPDLIRVNRNEENLGIINHFNKAIRLTHGDYVCILGADNRFRSDFLERTSALLGTDPNMSVAYTDVALFGPRADQVAADQIKLWPGRKVANKFWIIQYPEFDEAARHLLKERNFIHGSSLFRRAAFEAVGGYQDAKPLPEDYNLFRRFIDAGWSAGHLALPLLEYRQHSRDQANIQANSEALMHHYREGIRQYQEQLATLRNYIEQTHASVAWKIAAPVRVFEHFVRRRLDKWKKQV